MRFIRHFRGKITAVQQPNFALVSCWIVFADPLRNNSRVVVSPGVIATVTPFLLRRIRAIVTHVELGPWTPRHLRKVKYPTRGTDSVRIVAKHQEQLPAP